MKLNAVILLTLPLAAWAEVTNFTAESAAIFLGLTPPVRVTRAGEYADGGSIAITLVDATTNVFHMFEDHSIASRLAANKDRLSKDIRSQYENEPNTSGRIYIGDDRPTRSGRLTSVAEGIQIKAAVECLAVTWYDREAVPNEKVLFERIADLTRKHSPEARVLINKNQPQTKPTDSFESSLERTQVWRSKMYIAAKLKSKTGQPGDPPNTHSSSAQGAGDR